MAARHDGRVRCLAVVWRLPIGLKGSSEARLRLSGRQTRGRCNLVAGDAARCDLVDGSWKRLGSEARWTKSDESQMPCGCVAIGLKGASVHSVQRSAAGVCRDTGGKPGDAGTSTHAHGHLLMTIDIDGPSVQGAAGSEAELQLGSFSHSQHAFDAVWLLWTDLQSARAASSVVSAGASFTLHVSCTSRRVVQSPNLSRMLFYVALSRIVY